MVVHTRNNQYAFTYTFGDVVRGGVKADIEDTVVYTGETTGKHYVSESNLSAVPDEVVEEVASRGLTLLEDVDGGWSSWDGRPEFSTSYVDISSAVEV